MKTNCPICKGKKIEATTTFTVDLGKNIIVIRNTPATICSQCGEEWLSDNVVEEIEEIVSEAKSRDRLIEVVEYSQEKVA